MHLFVRFLLLLGTAATRRSRTASLFVLSDCTLDAMIETGGFLRGGKNALRK